MTLPLGFVFAAVPRPQNSGRCLSLLLDRGTIEKVILFGTMATGLIHEWSYIDLVVVERTELLFMRRVLDLRKIPRPFPDRTRPSHPSVLNHDSCDSMNTMMMGRGAGNAPGRFRESCNQ